ncbi:MAG: hypothetical protein KDA27_23780 [Candidatus Eisenbacteria bacterium]|uniref:Uncharacterized protein n=1 Tax=Eiseniibacteriota bacterium TaxID=2212470 RepID=A0A956NKJ4_UNCEI|nr:hypothetical protein [Candidatus Eisenbacteria bacterium]
MFYVQTAGDPDDGFLLEYQEGSLDQHFQSVRQDLPLETVEKTFQMYLVNDSSWKSGAEWAPLDLSSDVSGVSPALTLALGLSVALAGLLGWWRTA